MIKMVKVWVILCAVFVLVLPCFAIAMPVSTVDVVHSGFGANEAVTVWGGGLEDESVYGGVYMLNKTDGYNEGKIWPNGLIGAFCTELPQDAPETTLTYDVIGLEQGPRPITFLGQAMGTEKANYIRELWGRFFDSSWSSGGSYSWQQNIKAAAFASAIWEIVYENLPKSPLGWDVTVDGSTGNLGFRVEALTDLTDIANLMLHSLNGTGPMADLREPATIIILGIGGTLSLLRRKRRKV
jgi:hypothetical protein